jgi:5S rRNA maturation endonuclease (ribonuclease M5)
MKLDIVKILEDFGIETFPTGKNTQPGWINIQCPLCPDQTNHGGFNINIDEPYYSCWKCGWSSLYNVFKKLIPNVRFKELTENYKTFNSTQYTNPNTPKIKRNTKIIVPGTSTPLKNHIRYLNKRMFNDIDYLTMKYDLRYTDHLGDYKFRIIFPIYYKHRIISYQGRDVTDQQTLRYKACKKENELIDHKDILYNLDNCNKSYIGVVEGLFDCIKMGDNFAATFGISYTDNQIQLLKRYKRVFILFDSNVAGQDRAEKLSIALSSFGIDNEIIVTNVDDPAELTDKEVFKVKKELQIF